MSGDQSVNRTIARLDWPLLIFITLIAIDKVILKPFAILVGIILIARSISKQDFKAVPVFYLLIAALGTVNLLFLNNDFSAPHLISFAIGFSYWVMMYLAFVILANRVRCLELHRIENTLSAFFFINLFCSLAQLIKVMVQARSINPYGLDVEIYGNSTGDFIQGIFMAPCYINMFVNASFAVYFLYKRKLALSFFAAVLACLTTNNFANVIFIVILVMAFVALNDKRVRGTIFLQLSFYALFYLFISYGNLTYLIASFDARKIDTTESNALKSIDAKMVTKDTLRAAGTLVKGKNAKSKGNKASSVISTDTLVAVENSKIVVKEKHYGKLISFGQTQNFLLSSPGNFLFGAGIGEFSSQLALRTSDIKVERKSRLFERVPTYISQDFYNNHYQIFAAIYSLHKGYHSIRHLPNSVANQLLGEYGVIGLILFLFSYVWFFFKKSKSLSYGLFIGFMLVYFLLFDYMFEYISLVVFFELFFLIDIKRSLVKNEQQL